MSFKPNRVGRLRKEILVTAAALGLSACGGGGGGSGIVSTPPPPVTPPPTCTPPCFSEVPILPGVKTSTDLAVVGGEATDADFDGIAVTSSGFAAHYDAQTGLYTLTLPHDVTGVFKNNDANSPSQTYWNGALLDSSDHPIQQLTVLKSTNPELQLTYTTLAEYGDLFAQRRVGVFAFGSATAEGSVPVTGGASYAALVRGVTLDGAGYIQGSASLQFDFGAGKLSGHMDPTYGDFGGMGETYSLGRYDFVNTVYAVGSTTFSGELANSSFAQNGNFSGLFTGPNAEELMAGWSAPFINPISKGQSTMIGVWVGKR